MPDTKLAPFADQKYLSLETFKKNGQGVKTPVWFVLHENALYAYTEADSWKVKRIRSNPRVRVAVCGMRGDITDVWAYDVYSSYGTTRLSENFQNDVSISRLNTALQAVTDPRTSLPQTLSSLLAAELIDVASWEMLSRLARSMGRDDLAERFDEALEQENEHLVTITGWYEGLLTSDAKMLS